MYHVSYRTTCGTTFDELYENLADIAREFEDAGINLGWGGCSAPGAESVRESVEADVARRYLDARPNSFRLKLLTRRQP